MVFDFHPGLGDDILIYSQCNIFLDDDILIYSQCNIFLDDDILIYSQCNIFRWWHFDILPM